MSILGLVLIFQGAAAIGASKWEYRNFYGQYVFAPVGMLIGIMLIVVAISFALKRKV